VFGCDFETCSEAGGISSGALPTRGQRGHTFIMEERRWCVTGSPVDKYLDRSHNPATLTGQGREGPYPDSVVQRSGTYSTYKQRPVTLRFRTPNTGCVKPQDPQCLPISLGGLILIGLTREERVRVATTSEQEHICGWERSSVPTCRRPRCRSWSGWSCAGRSR
jgi:hypothetical protein